MSAFASRAEPASPGVTECRVSIGSLSGAGHFKLTLDVRSRDMVGKIYCPAIRAGGEIHFKPKFRIVDHDRLRSGDCAREHLVTRIDQCAFVIVDDRGHVIKNLPLQVAVELDY